MDIYRIDVQSNERYERFAVFLRDVYLPAIHTEATRVGQIAELTLLERNPEDADAEAGGEFFLHVGWQGTGHSRLVVDEEVSQRLSAFHPRITRLGEYTVLASWPAASVT